MCLAVPLHLACEGRFLAVVPAEAGEKGQAAINKTPVPRIC